jgi:hypothetical protein
VGVVQQRDGTADIVGRNSLTGDVRAATTNAPYPADAPLAHDYVPTPADIGVEPTPGSGGVQAAAAHKPAIGFQDDGRLLYRQNLTGPDPDQPTGDPFSNYEAEAVVRINHIYDRLHEVSGDGGIIRFNAYWGLIENLADATDPSGYRGGTRWDFDKLDRAVRLARAKGFKIELTVGGGYDACNGHFNSNSRNCTTPGNHQTTVNPSPSGYGEFVDAVVKHYTRNPANNAPLAANDPLRVDYFSLWNEPNNPANLKTGTRMYTTDLYHNLASAGWLYYWSQINAHNADPASPYQPVTGTTLVIGELESRVRSGWDPGDSSCDRVPSTEKKCKNITPGDFLKRVSRGGLTTQAVSMHPYQYYDAPWLDGRKSYRGIGRVDDFLNRMDSLCDWGVPVNSPGSPKQCRGTLRSPNNKRPRLMLTEFGYHNRPQGIDQRMFSDHNKFPEPGARNQRKYHTEKQRALWLGGGIWRGVRRKGAMEQVIKFDSQSSFSIDSMVLFTATEVQPQESVNGNQPNNSWDTGLIGRPVKDWDPVTAPDGDIIGMRNYGVASGKRGSNHSQKRRAYCALHKWAVSRGYVSANNNACP